MGDKALSRLLCTRLIIAGCVGEKGCGGLLYDGDLPGCAGLP